MTYEDIKIQLFEHQENQIINYFLLCVAHGCVFFSSFFFFIDFVLHISQLVFNFWTVMVCMKEWGVGQLQ